MSCCGRKMSGNSKAIQALLDKAWDFEEQGKHKESEVILEVLAEYYQNKENSKDKESEKKVH